MNIKKAALTVLSVTVHIVVIALIAIGLFRLGNMAFHYGHSAFYAEPIDAEPGRQISVSISGKESAEEIGKMLETKGLIEDWKVFYLQASLGKFSEKVLAGEYTLTTAMTPKEMMAVMSGEVLEEEEEV